MPEKTEMENKIKVIKSLFNFVSPSSAALISENLMDKWW